MFRCKDTKSNKVQILTESTLLYLVKSGEGYVLKASSSGFEETCWPVNTEAFLEKARKNAATATLFFDSNLCLSDSVLTENEVKNHLGIDCTTTAPQPSPLASIPSPVPPDYFEIMRNHSSGLQRAPDDRYFHDRSWPHYENPHRAAPRPEIAIQVICLILLIARARAAVHMLELQVLRVQLEARLRELLQAEAAPYGTNRNIVFQRRWTSEELEDWLRARRARMNGQSGADNTDFFDNHSQDNHQSGSP